MKDNQPIDIALWRYRFPITAVASILHRIAGVVMFLALPLLLYILYQSLRSPEQFSALVMLLNVGWMKGLIWLTVLSVMYHLIAGIRHICMDLGWGESSTSMRVTAWLVILLGVVAALVTLVGVLW